MYLLILFLPLLSTIITGFLGRQLGYYGASIFSTFCIFFSTLLSFFIFFEINISDTIVILKLSSWIFSDFFDVSWSFLFDNLTSSMLIIVNFISFLVHFYSIDYMKEDPHFTRFMSYLSIFTFFMLILVTAGNLVQMFVGWEGVGIASYLLINFWFTRLLANQSALKALITNRIGDFGLSLAILIIFFYFYSTDYWLIFCIAPLLENFNLNFLTLDFKAFTLIGIFLFIGAAGKSAQLGLHVWLPDAMEGPTPVSALIHAATMVTAGVFLIIRFSPLLEFSSITLTFLTLFGSLTAFFASMTGTFQNDLKKIIAYSTCSQLGYMIFSCGLSYYNVSLFHLINHAFFKALLFLSAGSIIHAMSDEQDLRRMGSLSYVLPITYSCILIGSLALVGFPFLTGFYSKDLILELTQIFRYNDILINFGSLTCWLGNLSVFFTSFYSFRLIFLTFLNNSNVSRITLLKIKESSIVILFPLIILTFGSIFIGYVGKDFFIGLGTDFWGNNIFIFPNNIFILEAEFLPIFLKWLPFFLSLLGIFFSLFLNMISINFYSYFLSFLINKKWYWDILYNRLIVIPLLNFGFLISFKTLDRGFIELAGPYGITIIALNWKFYFSILQTGQLIHYIFFFTISFCLFILLKFNFILSIFYFFLFFFI